MKDKKNIFFKILLLIFLFVPCIASAETLNAGDLVKTENLSSVYQIQANRTRLIFPTESVYKSYYNTFDNVKMITPEELKSYSLKGNVTLKIGSLVKFGCGSKVYEVKPNDELEWIKTEKGFKELGYDFKNVVTLPEIFWVDYHARITDGSSYDQVLDIIKSDFIDQEKAGNVDDIASSSKGLVEALGDEYSVFWTAKEYEDFSNWLDDDSFEGIGAEIGIRNEQLIIVTPLKGSPAEAAGLKPGDKIKFINNLDTTGMTTNKAAMNIRGPKGTEVILRIEREGVDKIINIPITRDTIVVSHFSWETIQTPSGRNVVYLSLSQFSLSAWDNFNKNQDDILNSNPRGIILDLRNDPGGYMEMALDVASRWLESDDLILIERRANDEEIRRVANDSNAYKNIPLVILVNNGSASASEIVTGALKDHDVATVIGVKTFGKGVVQEVVPLSDGNVMKLTVSEWLTPNGEHINKVGITPDIIIENSDDTKDLQLEEGLDEVDKIINSRFTTN